MLRRRPCCDIHYRRTVRSAEPVGDSPCSASFLACHKPRDGPVNQKLRIGTSGYQYDHWKDVLYPPDLPKGDWLGHFAECFDTVEINNTFYNLPEASTFESWAQQVPAGFLFALKYSQYGTQIFQQ